MQRDYCRRRGLAAGLPRFLRISLSSISASMPRSVPPGAEVSAEEPADALAGGNSPRLSGSLCCSGIFSSRSALPGSAAASVEAALAFESSLAPNAGSAADAKPQKAMQRTLFMLSAFARCMPLALPDLRALDQLLEIVR